MRTISAGMVRDYLMLGLRLGRLVDGFVDSWSGPPELAAQVSAEPPANPADLAANARLLLALLDETDLVASRREYLRAQLTALECVATGLAGTPMPFIHEVETYFQVSIGLGDPDEYHAVHAAIADLLPGPGSLRDRVLAFYERNIVPPERLRQAVQAVSDELRTRTHSLFGLPDGECVKYEVVEDKPWNAFNHYLGKYRSTITLNADAGRTVAALPLLATHEAYPGHHTEHCRKEAGLIGGLGQHEHHIALVNTPQCLMAEGIAEHGVTALLGAGWGEWTAGILADVGIRTDGELVEQMLNLVRRLLPVRQDATILLHDRGKDPVEVADYVSRWALLPRDRAEHMVQFLMDPLWRAYSVTYVEGSRLVGAWLAARPPDQSVAQRYRTLLDEPLLPSALRGDLATPGR